MKCKVCGYVSTSHSSFCNHLRSHKLTSKEYYDLYLKQSNEGTCLICGKLTVFLGLNRGYRKHCSKRCAKHDPEIILKTKNTNIEKYGVTNTLNIVEAQRKARQTNLERYGVEVPLSAPKIREKIKNTNLKKYGCENVFASKEYQQKIKQTLKEKYNVENPIYIPGNVEKLNSPEAFLKTYETKRKNCTFNTSKIEDETYQQLIQIFGADDVEHNYYCDRYPHSCDFYIKSLDLFIELNILWTHGGHWFGIDPNDSKTLKQWKDRAKTSKYYENVIKTWTFYDIEKRKDLEQLNHLVFWKASEIKTWINQLLLNI